VSIPFKRLKLDLEMRQRAEELFDKVGLKPWGHHLANDLSGGQQQRATIARDPCLAKHCDWIIELVDGRIDSDKPNAAITNQRKVNDV
jgi:putative ABC transport system ATP-binding protein